MSPRAHHRLADQSGFGLIEVLVTAVLVVVLATGVLAGIDAASSASGRTKARDVAASLAQADQERMRSTPMEQLSNLYETNDKRSCDEDGGTCVTYKVASRAYWVSDKSGTQTCSGSSAEVSYLKLVSTVTWPSIRTGRPVVSESMLAPPVSAAAENQGSLGVKLVGADGVSPRAGITVSLTGTKSYTAVTNDQGCVLWGFLPAGNGYTVTFDQAGYVGVNGVQQVVEPVGIIAQALTSRTYLYDRSATARVRFNARLGTTTYGSQLSDAATVLHGQMSPPERVFTATGGAPAASITTPPLFPFTTGSPGGRYRVYAGDCNPEDPFQQSPSQALSYLPNLSPGQRNAGVTVRLPALDTQVRVDGNPPLAEHDASMRFVPTTTGCVNRPWGSVGSLPVIPAEPDPALPQPTDAGRPQLASGIPAVGFPYGTYTVCAQATIDGTVRRQKANVALTTLAGAKVPAGPQPGVFDLNGSSEAESCDAP